jgi:hypothetical protein
VVRTENNVWREWFKERADEKKKYKRLNRAVKCMIKFEKRTWETFVLGLQEDNKGNKLFYSVMRNKMKPKT